MRISDWSSDVCSSDRPCEYDPSMPADDPNCVPPVEPCEYDPSMPADDPNCLPPANDCESFKVEPVTGGSYDLPGSGTITITKRDTPEGPVFDWTATHGIEWILVKGGTGSETYTYDPPATSGTGLRSEAHTSEL